MVRSMVAAVAGLRTHQSKMDVIGNNIANVNTWGFKSYSFNFQDSMYANSINGSGGDVLSGGAGGRNASQVGYGSQLSSITNEFGTGAPSPSSNPLDCMIDGTGFFLVGNMVNGTFTNVSDSGLYLSRVGIFRVDNNGYLVDDQRSYVYGYSVTEGTGIPEIPAAKSTYLAEGATITYSAGTGTNGLNVVTIGGVRVETSLELGPNSRDTDYKDVFEQWIRVAGADTNLQAYNFSFEGVNETMTNGTSGRINIKIEAKATGNNDNAVSGLATNTFGATAATQRVAGASWVPSVPAKYENDLSAIKIPNDPDTNQPYDIQSYKINEDGTIIGVDKQNRTIAIAQIALVTVENPNGLEKTSGYYYTPGANAGDVEAMKPNGGPSGKILGGYLEMANVDLANEFSNMITCQRGFQANSKIITVTDEMLSELVNMKR